MIYFCIGSLDGGATDMEVCFLCFRQNCQNLCKKNLFMYLPINKINCEIETILTGYDIVSWKHKYSNQKRLKQLDRKLVTN